MCVKYENPPDIAKALIDEALKKGANDNMTGERRG
jgi:serine/threonine protein phosphatase PrpC